MPSKDAGRYPKRDLSPWIAAMNHIRARCRSDLVAFEKCKEENPDPEKCLDREHQAMQCLLYLMMDIQLRCTSEFNSYADCLHYRGNELQFCRKEQEKFEKVCPS